MCENLRSFHTAPGVFSRYTMPSSPDSGYFQEERFLKQWGIKKYTNSNVSNYSQTPWGPGTPKIPGELFFNAKFSKESIFACVCVCVLGHFSRV